MELQKIQPTTKVLKPNDIDYSLCSHIIYGFGAISNQSELIFRLDYDDSQQTLWKVDTFVPILTKPDAQNADPLEFLSSQGFEISDLMSLKNKNKDLKILFSFGGETSPLRGSCTYFVAVKDGFLYYLIRFSRMEIQR